MPCDEYLALVMEAEERGDPFPLLCMFGILEEDEDGDCS